MGEVVVIHRPVYVATTKGRAYLTPRGAARGEASAMMTKKYPTEHAEYENGMCYYGGFHWSGDEQLVKVYERLRKRILRHIRNAMKEQP